MRSAEVYCLGIRAGLLSRDATGYRFTYFPEYLQNAQAPAISLTLPKREDPYTSPVLFPFFFGLLAEGDDKALQCRLLRIDEDDHFTRLLRTCHVETMSGVTVRELRSHKAAHESHRGLTALLPLQAMRSTGRKTDSKKQ
jgi:serine/threonine-protein kinase HipA